MKLEYNNRTVYVRFLRRRGMSLSVRGMRVTASVPAYCSLARIRAFLDAQDGFIAAALQKNGGREDYSAGEVDRFGQTARQVLDRYAQLMGLNYADLVVRNANSYWGKCSYAKGRIFISTRLIDKPPECLEYVAVHELAHLVYHNHGRDFYALVKKFYPDYATVRRLLK